MSEVKRFTFELFHCNGGDMTPDDEGEYVSYEDYAEWQQKLDALAAENAALKSSIPSLKHVDLDNDNIDDVSLAKDIGLNDAVTLMNRWKGETPATDAYLNAVRADAVEDAAKQLYGQGYTFEVLTKFAAQFRSGTMTTNSPNPVDGDLQALIERLNRVAERLKWHNVGYAQDILKAVNLLTNPTAQILRPVVLPEPYDDGHGNLWLPQDAVISAVKNAGGEVKP